MTFASSEFKHIATSKAEPHSPLSPKEQNRPENFPFSFLLLCFGEGILVCSWFQAQLSGSFVRRGLCL